MTDSATPAAPAPGAPAPVVSVEEPTVESLRAEVETIKGHSRKWEDRAKANLAAVAEVETLKASTASLTTERDEARTALEEARMALEEATRISARVRVAATHGISMEPGADGAPSMADLLLTGDTEEAMTAQAVALAAGLPPRLTPDPSQGRRSGDGVVTDPTFEGAVTALLAPN